MLAGAAAVSALILLYFLKLRRRRLPIASTLLWLRATEDLQANAPFQRLRFSILLLLQLLVVATLAAALARPVLEAQTPTAARVILLIDHSGSMNATDVDAGSRLDAAKAQAGRIVSRLGRRSEPAQLMVVAFARHPQVICSFEHNRRLLLEAIDSIEPTDEIADLDKALALAGVFARRRESATAPAPKVVLISDGGVEEPTEPGGFFLGDGELRFIRVGPDPGEAVNNIGIAAFSARRDYRNPSRLLLFARIVNAGPEPINSTATLRADGEPVAISAIHLPAADDKGPGQTPFSHTLELDRGAVVTISCGGDDDLPGDDTAALLICPPAAARIALIHPSGGPDPFLSGLLEAVATQRLVKWADTADEDPLLRAAEEFDLVIFDRVPARRWPDVATLSFGVAGTGIGVRAETRPGGKRILSWDRQHPLMRHVSLDGVVFSGFGAFELPSGARPLAIGPDGPVIALVADRRADHVLVGFELAKSNWPVDVSIAVFLQNVLEGLTLPGQRSAAASQPGLQITVGVVPGSRRLAIRGPQNATVDVSGASQATLPTLHRAGLYTVQGALPPMDRIALSMLSDVESDIRTRPSLLVNARQTPAAAVRSAAALELWPALAAAAFGLLLLEWIVYCVRMRG